MQQKSPILQYESKKLIEFNVKIGHIYPQHSLLLGTCRQFLLLQSGVSQPLRLTGAESADHARPIETFGLQRALFRVCAALIQVFTSDLLCRQAMTSLPENINIPQQFSVTRQK
jgi:hypothetical protein